MFISFQNILTILSEIQMLEESNKINLQFTTNVFHLKCGRFYERVLDRKWNMCLLHYSDLSQEVFPTAIVVARVCMKTVYVRAHGN